MPYDSLSSGQNFSHKPYATAYTRAHTKIGTRYTYLEHYKRIALILMRMVRAGRLDCRTSQWNHDYFLIIKLKASPTLRVSNQPPPRLLRMSCWKSTCASAALAHTMTRLRGLMRLTPCRTLQRAHSPAIEFAGLSKQNGDFFAMMRRNETTERGREERDKSMVVLCPMRGTEKHAAAKMHHFNHPRW